MGLVERDLVWSGLIISKMNQDRKILKPFLFTIFMRQCPLGAKLFPEFFFGGSVMLICKIVKLIKTCNL